MEQERLEHLWKEAGDAKSGRTPDQIEEDMQGILSAACAKCLRDLYPQVEVFA
jgi:hypothetical protein